MAIGYDGKLYILAFDHRGSFQKRMFEIDGDPTAEERATIVDSKHLVYEGMVRAAQTGQVAEDQLGPRPGTADEERTEDGRSVRVRMSIA